MSFVDSGYYEAQRRGIENQYAAGMASNTYAQQLAQTRGSRDLSFMREGFRRQTPSFTSGFAQRRTGGPGIRSGVMRQQMSNYLGDYTRDYTTAQNDITEQLRQFDLQSAQLGAGRSSALADMELEKAREIAFAAQNIAALRQMFGGT